ncbi:MAG: restriction endonuclease subunit S, partial [Anaerovoracaceae bacterium]
MTEWQKVKLGDIAEIRRGASPRPIQDYFAEEGIPWVKIADVTGIASRYVNSTKQYIKESGKRNSVEVFPNDLILSNSATPGIPKFLGIYACIHDGWLLLKENSDINKQYLYYKLLHIRPELVGNANGSVFNNLKIDIVKDFEINLPSIEIQTEIAGTLSCLDAKIELNNRINKNLEEQAQAIFKRWFVDFEFPDEEGKPYKTNGGEFVESDLGMIPKGWRVGKVEDFFNITIGKTPPRKEPQWFTKSNFDVKWLS